MFKKILKLYLISISILILLALIYTIYLYLSKNEATIPYLTLIIGSMFHFFFSFLLMKIFNNKVFLYVSLFFIINMALFILLSLTSNNLSKTLYYKIPIFYLLALTGGIFGKKKPV